MDNWNAISVELFV